MNKSIIIIVAILFLPLSYGMGVKEIANSVGMIVHPIYITLGYAVAPILNVLFSLSFNIGLFLIFTVILSPIGFIILALSGIFKIATMFITYGFPLLYLVLGILGRNPNFFIGSIGDLIGHFFVDLGSLMTITIILIPLAALFIALGDMITLFGNGLSVWVVGDRFTAVQQFIGAFILLILLATSIVNILGCLTIVWIPFALLFSFILILLTNFVGLGTDILGQIITYAARFL